MRLYLSSFGLGPRPDDLLSMLRGPRTAVIANAMDPYPDRGLETEAEMFRPLGLDIVEVDLREHFADPTRIRDDLTNFDLLWVRGGNVFALRQALARSGADRAIVDLLKDDAFVYGGYSAGPCVLAPSLRGLEFCDDPKPVEAMYGEPVIFDGLGILDFAFVPHVDSVGHPETEALTEVAERYRCDGVPFRAFRDGQVLVRNGDEEYVVG